MTTGAALAVFTEVTTCDGYRGPHEVQVWTDGMTAYATTVDARGTTGRDVEAVLRDGVTLSGSCPALMGPGEGEPCAGALEWDLSTPGTWTADPDALRHVTAYGSLLEQA